MAAPNDQGVMLAKRLGLARLLVLSDEASVEAIDTAPYHVCGT